MWIECFTLMPRSKSSCTIVRFAGNAFRALQMGMRAGESKGAEFFNPYPNGPIGTLEVSKRYGVWTNWHSRSVETLCRIDQLALWKFLKT